MHSADQVHLKHLDAIEAIETKPVRLEVKHKEDTYIFEELKRKDQLRIMSAIAPFFARAADLNVKLLTEVLSDPNFVDTVVSSYMHKTVDSFQDLPIEVAAQCTQAFMEVNPRFFSELVEKYTGLLLSISAARSSDLSTMEDLNLHQDVSETMVKVLAGF